MSRLLLTGLLLLCVRELPAQSPPASPFLQPAHWSYGALRRLEIAKQLPAGSDIARRSLPQEEIAALLEFAASQEAAGAARSFLNRFREEFTPARTAGLSRLDASARASYRARRNQLQPGIGYDTAWSGAQPISDDSDADALLRGAWSLGRIAVAVGATQQGITELQFVLASAAVGAWAGRRELGYATGMGGGVVLDRHRMDGGGLFLAAPVRIPLLGRLRLETHVARFDNLLNLPDRRLQTDPWFFTARGSAEPHDNLTLGLNRGIMFGGEGNLPVTAKRVLRALAGASNADDENSFANQVLSVDIRYRVPRLPVAAYVEWGTEDASGAWWDVPGIVAGLEFSALPRRDVSIGVERTEFKKNRGRNSHWYQNAWFQGSWTDDGAALGHPLGGHGIEWRAFASGGAPQAASLTAAMYRRHRRMNNLFAPERAGTSIGVAGAADVRLHAVVRLLLSGELERGTGEREWTAGTVNAGIQLRF